MGKLKGKTTISLFNAKTGAKELEVCDHNIVTNALTNLFNTPINFKTFDGNPTFQNSLYNSNLPFFKNLMGGILLFSEEIPENADTCLAPAGKVLIGHAGDQNEVENDPRCGEFNSAESLEIENGYRFVWDFDTDKGNGLISTVGLTSTYAGMNGGAYFYEASAGTQVPFIYITSDFNSKTATVMNPSTFLILDDITADISETSQYSNILYVKQNEDSTLDLLLFLYNVNKVYKLTIEHPAKRFLTQTKGYKLKEYKELISLGAAPHGIWVSPDLKLHVTRNTSTTRTEHIVYNIDSGEQETQTTVTLPVANAALASTVGFYDGKYYYYAREDGKFELVEATDSEAVSKTSVSWSVSANDGQAATFGVYSSGEAVLMNKPYGGNCYCSLISGEEKAVMVRANGSGGGKNSIPSFVTVPLIDGDFVKEPWIPTSMAYSLQSQKYAPILVFNVRSNYLATINRLEAPVTKTEAHTMKITYELTEVDE